MFFFLSDTFAEGEKKEKKKGGFKQFKLPHAHMHYSYLLTGCRSHHTSQLRLTLQKDMVPTAALTVGLTEGQSVNTPPIRQIIDTANSLSLCFTHRLQSAFPFSFKYRIKGRSGFTLLAALAHPACVLFSSRVPFRTIHPLHDTAPGLALFGPGRVSGRGQGSLQ